MLICPDCLFIGHGVCPHCNIKMIGISNSKARVPRQKASNREWRLFIERFCLPEVARQFKVVNPKITEEEREAYRRKKESEAFFGRGMRSRVYQYSEVLAKRQEGDLSDRKIRALKKEVKKELETMRHEISKQTPLILTQYETAVNEKGALTEAMFAEKEALSICDETEMLALLSSVREVYMKQIESKLSREFSTAVSFICSLDLVFYEARRVCDKSW